LRRGKDAADVKGKKRNNGLCPGGAFGKKHADEREENELWARPTGTKKKIVMPLTKGASASLGGA